MEENPQTNSSVSAWAPLAACSFRLEAGEVDVWHARLDDVAEKAVDRTLLSKEEQARARRFLHVRRRQQFVLGRVLARRALGRYLAVAAERLTLGIGEQGKPFIEGHGVSRAYRFNLSHSGERVVLAVGREVEVGVDIERVRLRPEYLSLARRFFSEREVAALESLEEPLRSQAFFCCWARKESFLKARATGLSESLSLFSVTVDPREAARLLELRQEDERLAHYWMTDLPMGKDYQAALTVTPFPRRVRCYEWVWEF